MVFIKNGDWVYIIFDKRRKWVRKVINDKEFHSDRGFLRFNEIIGNEFGTTALLHPSNYKVAILPAFFSDMIYSMKRQSQIIYPEDIGLILTYSNISLGSKIIEAGTGSGTVTSIMGIFCQQEGQVYSFDVRNIAIKQAIKNIRDMDAEKFCTIQLGNICEEDYDYDDIDFILLDLATTWEAIPKVVKYLSSKGKICCFSPTIEQVKKNHRILKTNQFKNVTTIELLKRTFQVKPNATRPLGRVIGHTGYMTFASCDSEELLSSKYFSYYSPENIGYILIHLGCRPGDQILIISPFNSPLPDLLSQFYGNNQNLKIIKLDIQDPENMEPFKTQLNEIIQKIQDQDDNSSNSELFDAIIIDSISSDYLIKELQEFLKKGNAFCILSQYIEHAKFFYDELWQLNYYQTSTIELIKRQVKIEPQGSFSTIERIYNPGYITIGRKVVDLLEDPKKDQKKEKEPEFVETLLEVALDYSDNMPKEGPEKIDYGNLRDAE